MNLLERLDELTKRQEWIREKLRRRLRKYTKPSQQRLLIATHECEAAILYHEIERVKDAITLSGLWPESD